MQGEHEMTLTSPNVQLYGTYQEMAEEWNLLRLKLIELPTDRQEEA